MLGISNVAATATGGASIAPQAVTKLGQIANALKIPKHMIPTFLSTVGNNYHEARKAGAGDRSASLYALTSGYANTLLESGGLESNLARGLEGVKQSKNWREAFGNFVKDNMLSEGKEEVLQNISDKALRKTIIDKSAPFVSFKDENAVINPKREAESFAIGSLSGGIMGGLTGQFNAPKREEMVATEENAREDTQVLPYEAENGETVDSGVRFSFDDNAGRESKSVLNIVKQKVDSISENEIFDVESDNNVSLFKRVSDYVLDIFNKQGNIAHNSKIGNVDLGKSGAKSTIFHGFGETKLAAVKAIKSVIENGDIVSHTTNYENSSVDRYVLAAKGYINKKPALIGVVVKSYPNQKSNSKFYLHEAEIIETDSPIMTAPQLSVDAVSKPESMGAAPQTLLAAEAGKPTTTPYNEIISEEEQIVNGKNLAGSQGGQVINNPSTTFGGPPEGELPTGKRSHSGVPFRAREATGGDGGYGLHENVDISTANISEKDTEVVKSLVFADFLARRFGVRIKYIDDPSGHTNPSTAKAVPLPLGKGGRFSGKYSSGTIFINVAKCKNRTAYEILAHEFGHSFRDINSQGFYELLALVKNSTPLTTRFREYSDRINARYKQMGMEANEELVSEELLCDIFAEVFKNPHSLETICEGDKTLMQKIGDALREFIGYVKEFFAGRKNENIRKIVDDFDAIERKITELVTKSGKMEGFSDSSERFMMSDENDYTYQSLISKPDIFVPKVSEDIPLNAKGSVDRKAVAEKAIENIRKKNNPKNTENNSFIHVKDIEKDVLITVDGLRHGLTRKPEITAKVTLNISDILENSIKINELKPKKTSDGGYVLLGIGMDSEGNYYPTRIIVNHFSVSEVEVLDVLYAVNAKQKRASLHKEQGFAENSAPLIKGSSTISVADFLDIVKGYFPDILPDDVLRELNTQRPNSTLSESVRYAFDDEVSEEEDAADREERRQRGRERRKEKSRAEINSLVDNEGKVTDISRIPTKMKLTRQKATILSDLELLDRQIESTREILKDPLNPSWADAEKQMEKLMDERDRLTMVSDKTDVLYKLRDGLRQSGANVTSHLNFMVDNVDEICKKSVTRFTVPPFSHKIYDFVGCPM